MSPILNFCHHFITSSKTTADDLLLPICSMASCIQAIPFELLQETFLKNTELDDIQHDRLTTARFCSQVCRSWRSILLQSPRVWGRLLDLDYLEKSKSAWKKELVSRIGDAPIWMEGRIRQSTYSVVVSVLEKKWQNVQILQLRGSLEQYPTADWSFLGRAAPNLERLFIHFPDPWDITPKYSSILFNNAAPKLRQFEFSAAFQLDASAPWFSNLHTLILSTEKTVTDILTMLKATPRLEHLHILRHCVITEEDARIFQIDLPCLKFLHLAWAECSEVVPFLESISPSPRCLLSLEKYAAVTTHGSTSVMRKMFRAILRWLVAYGGAGYLPKDITLNVIGGSSSGVNFLWIHGSNPGTELPRYVRTSLDVQFPYSNAYDTFMKPLIASSPFSSVLRLRLIVFTHKHNDCFLPFLRTFSSVTHFISDPKSIGALCNSSLDETQPHFFPHLRTVEVRPALKEARDWIAAASQLRTVCNFLEHRVAIGLPVSVLDIYNLTPYIHDHGLNEQVKDRIHKIEGLFVKWGPKHKA
ncbi:hypothetical protein CPC08DRAFT_293936 [Agrocybe pediades]|nr:hypothetical protein CPC08DRAFT_293936 [Agrocybe pediades]